MEKNNIKKQQNVYVSEEENTLNWLEVQNAFKKTFGGEIYNSWLQKISLEKEFNDYLILGVPTRFFRDWIVSRYLDKILEQVKSFKLSLNRIEFKIIEESKSTQDLAKIDQINKVTVGFSYRKFRNLATEELGGGSQNLESNLSEIFRNTLRTNLLNGVPAVLRRLF